MANDEQAQAAIAALNGSEVEGRNLVVNESLVLKKVARTAAAVASRKEALAAAVAAALRKAAAVDLAAVETVAAAAADTIAVEAAAAAVDTETAINPHISSIL